MAQSGDITVKINSAQILELEKDGETIVFNPKAEDAILKLLEIRREVDGAIEYLKSAVERQALGFNRNFSALKGEKIKINYSASGPKYKEVGEVKNHREKFWTKKTVWSPNSKAIDEYRAKYYKLPKGIAEVVRKKTVRISEVDNGQ